MTGCPHEMQDLMECVALGREPLSGAPLARDVTGVIHGAYLPAVDGRRMDRRPFLADMTSAKAPE